MNKLFSLFLAFFISAGMVYSQKATLGNTGTTTSPLKWDKQTVELGDILLGSGITQEYVFVNSGSTDLKLNSVTTKNPALTIDFSKEAIVPGASGYVKASFKADVAGLFEAKIQVSSNSSAGDELLVMTANVKKSMSSGSSK